MMFLDSPQFKPALLAYLAAGGASWRNETDPETVSAYMATARDIRRVLRRAGADCDASDRYAIAQGTDYFAGAYYAGQTCPLYRVLCRVSVGRVFYASPGAVDRIGPPVAAFLARRYERSQWRAMDTAERLAVILDTLHGEGRADR